MRDLSFRIDVNSSGAVRGNKQAQDAFKKTSEEAQNAKKATDTVNEANQKLSKDASQHLGELANVFQRMGVPLGGFTKAIQTARKAQVAATASSKALRLALIALPFVAIAAAVMTLFRAFTSTQEGSDRLQRALAPLRAIMQSLFGVVQDLSIALVDVFTNPRALVVSLWETIRDNLVNRVRGLIDFFGSVGRAIQAALSLDFDEVSNQVRNAGSSIVQTMTGSEKSIREMGRSLVDAFERGKISVEEMVDQLQQAARAGERIQELEEQIRQARIDSVVPLAQMRREYEEARSLSRDTTLSEEERLKHTQTAIGLAKQRRDAELEILDMQIEQLELQQSLNDTSAEEELQLQRLIAQRDELAANTERAVGRLIVRESQLIETIDGRIIKEQEAQRLYIEGLEERAERFRDMLLTEEELRQRDIEEQVEQIRHLQEQRILSEEEALAIIQQLRAEDDEEDIERREVHADSILALEERLREAQQEFREAATEAERMALEERIEMMQQELDAKLMTERSMQKAEQERIKASIEAQNRAVGQSIANEIRRADSIEEAGKGIIRSLTREAVLRVVTQVIQRIPWPANLVAAPVAAAATERMIQNLPGFATGGIVGSEIQRSNGDNRLITARTGEVVLTEAQQQRIGGSAALGAAGVPGFDSFAGRLDGIADRLDDIRVVVDLDDTVRKIEQRQRVTQRTEIEVV